MSAAWRRRIPSIAIAALLAVAVLYVLPKANRQPLFESAAWAGVLLASFAGWGWLVARLIAPRERVDLGLMASWGASAMAFAGGCLLVPSAMNRTAALLLVDVGLLGALAGLFVDAASVHARARLAVRVVRREPKLALIGALILLAIAIQCAGGISEWHTNPYDDDIAYLPFARKMIDTGSFPEPFSFRRLSAMGGQTFFVAITTLRTGFRQANTFDRTICVVMIVMLLAGHRVRGRRPSFLFLGGVTVLFLTLQNIAINTASYFSGVVFFLALYRTLAWLGDKPRAAWKNALPLALVGAAACTLRQNFLPIPAVTLAVSYLFRFVGAKDLRWRQRLVEPTLAMVFSLVALAPWMVSQWQSNHTFLYPVMGGTFNQALALQSSGMTLVRELQMQIWVAIDGVVQFKTLGFFLVACAFVRERDTRKPLWSFLIGCSAGFVLLVHGLTQGDAGNIGRYAYGFLMAFALAAALQIGLTRWRGRFGRPQVAASVALFAILLQLVFNRDWLYPAYLHQLTNIDLIAHYPVRGPDSEKREAWLYGDLQRTVPEGARMAVLLDEPYYLDFARNPIWNLDMPGYASLPPGIPFFSNADALEGYYRQIGVRYVAFVDPRYSRYHYRREYWVEMIASDSEIWRLFAPYLIDFLDRMMEIQKRHHHLYDWRGLMVIDLEAPP